MEGLVYLLIGLEPWERPYQAVSLFQAASGRRLKSRSSFRCFFSTSELASVVQNVIADHISTMNEGSTLVICICVDNGMAKGGDVCALPSSFISSCAPMHAAACWPLVCWSANKPCLIPASYPPLRIPRKTNQKMIPRGSRATIHSAEIILELFR